MKRLITGITAGVAGLAAAAAFALPASAAGAAKIPGTEENTYILQERTVTDAGGQQFKVQVLWAETYTTASGNIRVSVPYVRINALGVDLDTIDSSGGGIDAKIIVNQGYADGHTVTIQSLAFDGADDPLKVNVKNPLNRPNITNIKVAGVGVDDDGKAGAPTETFVQPVVGDEDPGADGIGVES